MTPTVVQALSKPSIPSRLEGDVGFAARFDRMLKRLLGG